MNSDEVVDLLIPADRRDPPFLPGGDLRCRFPDTIPLPVPSTLPSRILNSALHQAEPAFRFRGSDYALSHTYSSLSSFALFNFSPPVFPPPK